MSRWKPMGLIGPPRVHSNRRPCSSQTTRTGFPLIKIFGACLASRPPVVAPPEPR